MFSSLKPCLQAQAVLVAPFAVPINLFSLNNDISGNTRSRLRNCFRVCLSASISNTLVFDRSLHTVFLVTLSLSTTPIEAVDEKSVFRHFIQNFPAAARVYVWRFAWTLK